MSLKTFLLSLMLLPLLAQSQQLPENLEKRFRFVRTQSGELIAVRAPWLSNRMSVRPFIEQVKRDLFNEQQIFASYAAKGQTFDYRQQLRAELAQLEDVFESQKSGKVGLNFQQIMDYLENAIANLSVVDGQGAVDEVAAEGLLEEYALEMERNWTHFQLDIVARLDDARFFYRRASTHKILDWALGQAARRFSSLPLLNTISYILKQVHRLTLEQRAFAQNMLLYYLDRYQPAELGLSTEEYGHILSSIYESRISWFNYIESNRAAENWLRYGSNHYYAVLRGASGKLNNYVQRHSVQEATRLNFAFARVQSEENDLAINLINNVHSYTANPAVAFDFNRPHRIRNLRRLIRLGQLGLSFLPIPNWIKSNVDSFASSTYQPHVLTEGALVGWFEDQGDEQMVQLLMNQIANPFFIR